MKTLITLFSIITPALLTAQSIFTNHLILDLPFNGNAINQSEILIEGIEVNGPVLCEGRNSISNSAYLFDGIDDFIRIPHHDSLNFENSYSVSFWVKLSNDIVGEQERIIGKGLSHTGDVPNWSFTFKSDQQLDYFWEPTDDSNMLTSTDEPLDSQKFYHIVGLVDVENSESRLYINGQLKQINPTYNQYPAPNNYDLILGLRENYQLQGDFDNFFDGIIDDIKIYSEALNDCEVLTLYNDGSMSYPNFIPLEIIQDGNTLSANLYADTYQWYQNGIEIIGENNHSIIVSEEGNYQLQVTREGCSSELSEVYYFLSNSEIQNVNFTIYPNPSTNSIKILTGSYKLNLATIKSIDGKTMMRSESETIEFKNKVNSGIYILEIDFDDHQKSYQRFIVE